MTKVIEASDWPSFVVALLVASVIFVLAPTLASRLAGIGILVAGVLLSRVMLERW